MNYAAIIERISADNLSKVEYRYYNIRELEMILDWIVYYSRPTTRHKFKRVRGWYRLERRGNDMPREEPPQEVKDELVKKMNEAIKFT